MVFAKYCPVLGMVEAYFPHFFGFYNVKPSFWVKLYTWIKYWSGGTAPITPVPTALNLTGGNSNII